MTWTRGGGGGSGVETAEKSTSSSRLDAREVVVVANESKMLKKSTSVSRLDAREVVMAKALKTLTISSQLSNFGTAPSAERSFNRDQL